MRLRKNSRLSTTFLAGLLWVGACGDDDAASDAFDAASPLDGAAQDGPAVDTASADGGVADTATVDGTTQDAQSAPGASNQDPPEGRAALEAWLAAGHYKAWACEPGIMNARPNGAHGRNRVCSNALLSGHAGGPYPVGAASVKELYDAGGKITGYAVARKRAAGTGVDTWYWYELLGGSLYADGVGVGLCTGCHAMAAQRGGHDYVYVQVKK